jgi:hypothetical protein
LPCYKGSMTIPDTFVLLYPDDSFLTIDDMSGFPYKTWLFRHAHQWETEEGAAHYVRTCCDPTDGLKILRITHAIDTAT